MSKAPYNLDELNDDLLRPRGEPRREQQTEAHGTLSSDFLFEHFFARAGKAGFLGFLLHSRETAQYASKRWSAIAIPSGWYEVIRGPRPPSVQWPLVSKGKGKGKGKQPSPVVSAPPKSQQSKVARLEAALQALGQEQSTAKTALDEALKVAKEDVPKPVHPQQRTAEASARVARLEAALQMLGEDDPDAEPLCAQWGERLDLCLQYVARVKKQVARAEDHVRTGQRNSFANPSCKGGRAASTVPWQHMSRDGSWKSQPIRRHDVFDR